jgi:hypothetical protein
MKLKDGIVCYSPEAFTQRLDTQRLKEGPGFAAEHSQGRNDT